AEDRPVPPRPAGPTLVPVRPEGTEPRTAPAPPPAPRAEAPEGLDGLPRRVRQASLVPQLREPDQPAAADDRPAEGGRAEDDFERDAEEVRARMAAMQRGWQRGRRHGSGPDDSTAHGTTPEGDGR
ncbi:histidine kinase, partial [Streptomyces roseolus]